MIWFTSDTHGYHTNITKGVSTWDDKDISCRDFQTMEEMTDAVIDSINRYVMEDDTLYHLGDWSFGGIENIWNFRKRIKCKNIHLILGNHDDHIKKNKILPNCHWVTKVVKIDGCDTVQNDYIEDATFIDPLNPVRAKDLFISVDKYLELKIEKKTVILSHYAFEEWYEMDLTGSYHLHGHNHHRFDSKELNTKYRRMDVGMDWEEFRPDSWDEIKEIMKSRKIKKHNS